MILFVLGEIALIVACLMVFIDIILAVAIIDDWRGFAVWIFFVALTILLFVFSYSTVGF